MKILGLIRAGKNSIHQLWLGGFKHESIDFVLSAFDEDVPTTDEILATHFCKGSKFFGAQDFYKKNQTFLKNYDYIWLIEDDLFIPASTIYKVVAFCNSSISVCFQPSLEASSYFSHNITVQNTSFDFRVSNFVEIMAPIFSMNFFSRIVEHFGFNYSGWGYEWLWQKYLLESGEFACILDNAPIFHTRPIGGGDLYKNNNLTTLDAEEEKNKFINFFALQESVQNYYGCNIIDGKIALTQSNDELIKGYQSQSIDPIKIERLLADAHFYDDGGIFADKLKRLGWTC